MWLSKAARAAHVSGSINRFFGAQFGLKAETSLKAYYFSLMPGHRLFHNTTSGCNHRRCIRA